MANFSRSYKRITASDSEPPPQLSDKLKLYWSRPVSELCELADPDVLRPPDKERHRIYALLLMSVTWHYWNGNKRGRGGEYLWNDAPAATDPEWMDGDYRGHNIAAIAVDAAGRIIDFDFNHNNLFNSSAEHAEARLVRRLYSLAQLSEAWSAAPDPGAALGDRGGPSRNTNLTGVTVYTTLESCAQCSGIMALAQIKEVIYLQTDPGMYFIGRILRNLSTVELRAPLPIAGAEIGLEHFAELDDAFTDYGRNVSTEKPFWRGPTGVKVDRDSVTSFLCTSAARDIFRRGGDALARLGKPGAGLKHPRHIPTGATLTNAQVLKDARAFLEYAVREGRRGTPHNL